MSLVEYIRMTSLPTVVPVFPMNVAAHPGHRCLWMAGSCPQVNQSHMTRGGGRTDPQIEEGRK